MDATHLLYLLDLFENRLTYTDIMNNVPLNLLTEMQKVKEEQLMKEYNKNKKISETNAVKSQGKGGTITNTGKRTF